MALLSAADLADLESVVEDAMIATAVVKTEDATTHALSVVANAALPCYLSPLPDTDTTASRGERAKRRILTFNKAYTMPATARVEVMGRVWNVASGTRDDLDVLGNVIAHKCELVAVP